MRRGFLIAVATGALILGGCERSSTDQQSAAKVNNDGPSSQGRSAEMVPDVSPHAVLTRTSNTVTDDKAWYGTWQCETFGEESVGRSIVVRLDDAGWQLLGNLDNPFYRQKAKSGPVKVYYARDEKLNQVDLIGLNSSPPSGKWIIYDNQELLWVSFSGEGSENACVRLN